MSSPFLSNFTLMFARLTTSIWYESSFTEKSRAISYPLLTCLFAISAFLIPLEFLLNRTSSKIRGIEDLPAPFVPISCVKVLSLSSISLSEP